MKTFIVWVCAFHQAGIKQARHHGKRFIHICADPKKEVFGRALTKSRWLALNGLSKGTITLDSDKVCLPDDILLVELSASASSPLFTSDEEAPDATLEE